MDTFIAECQHKLSIPGIQNLQFNLPHLTILVNHHCGKEFCEEFKRQSSS